MANEARVEAAKFIGNVREVARLWARIDTTDRERMLSTLTDIIQGALERAELRGQILGMRTTGDAVQLAMGGCAEETVTICVADRRYNLPLEAGDVALIDYRGQQVLLGPDGVVVDAAVGAEIKLGASATAGAARKGDPVKVQSGGLWDTWLKAVGTATGAGAPPTATAIGLIDSGSSKTLIE